MLLHLQITQLCLEARVQVYDKPVFICCMHASLHLLRIWSQDRTVQITFVARAICVGSSGLLRLSWLATECTSHTL